MSGNDLICSNCRTPYPSGSDCPQCYPETAFASVVSIPQAPLLPGYKISHQLGEGGMGTVFLGMDETLGRPVAIKVISKKLTDKTDSEARFLREARVMATVEHPCVVRVYAFEKQEGADCLVMEYIEGESLADRINREHSMKLEDALHILRQCAEALEAAWEKGIVHRDIKPSNILLDRKNRVHVADFGLAKPIAVGGDASLTSSGLLIGTPHYLSPEQAQGHSLDFRSDVYSLGIVLYEMLTGERPYIGTTPIAVVAKHLNAPFPSIKDKRPELPQSIVHLVEWMTAKNPEQRPSSYQELLQKIPEFRAGTPQPTTVTRDEVATPVRKPSAIRRIFSVPRMVLVVLLVLSVIWAFSQKQRKRQWAAEETRQSRFVLLLAPFYSATSAGEEDGQVMRQLLFQKLTDVLEGEKAVSVLTPEIKNPPRSQDEAREIGKLQDADLVVWGRVVTLKGETTIEPQLTRLRARDQTEKSAASPNVQALQVSSSQGNQLELRQAKSNDIADVALTIVANEVLHGEKALQILRKIDTAYSLVCQAGQVSDTKSKIELYQKAIDKDPNLAEAHAGLGHMYIYACSDARALCDRDKGVSESKRALELDPNNVRALGTLAYVARLEKNPSDAISYLKRIQEASPDDLWNSMSLAMAYEWNGQSNLAESVLHNVKLEDDEYKVWFYQSNGMNNAIIEFYEKRKPSSKDSYALLIDAYTAMEKYDKAYEAYLNAKSFSTSWLGSVKVALGLTDREIEGSSSDDESDLDEKLAWIYLGQGKCQEARSTVEKSRLSDFFKNYITACSFLLEGKPAQAIEPLTRASNSGVQGAKIMLYTTLMRLGKNDEASKMKSDFVSQLETSIALRKQNPLNLFPEDPITPEDYAAPQK